MRLGQLSRKVGVSTTEIIRFLTAKNVAVNEDSNAKVEDEHANWVIEKYAPHLLQQVTVALAEEKIEVTPSVIDPIETIEIRQKATTDKPEAFDEQPITEIITAPKIELSGLKVLGKIEIAEKKKKEIDNTEQATEVTVDAKPRVEKRQRPHREFQERPQKNPIALQREREEQEAQKTRKEKALREKEKKTYNYLSRVQPQTSVKKTRYLKEEITSEPIAEEEAPKTLWGKFKKWLRT